MAAPTVPLVPLHPLPVEVPQLTELDEALADLLNLSVPVQDAPPFDHLDPCGVCTDDEEDHPIRDGVAEVVTSRYGVIYPTRVCPGHLVDEVRYQRVQAGTDAVWVGLPDAEFGVSL